MLRTIVLPDYFKKMPRDGSEIRHLYTGAEPAKTGDILRVIEWNEATDLPTGESLTLIVKEVVGGKTGVLLKGYVPPIL